MQTAITTQLFLNMNNKSDQVMSYKMFKKVQLSNHIQYSYRTFIKTMPASAVNQHQYQSMQFEIFKVQVLQQTDNSREHRRQQKINSIHHKPR